MNAVTLLIFRNEQLFASRGRAAAIRHARQNGLFARLRDLGALRSDERAVCPAL